MKNTREIAMLTLYEIEYKGAYSNMALKNQLAKHKEMQAIDKAFITNIVYGSVKQKLTLDYVIGKYSKIKLKKISKYILQILRIGVYQMMFMDKVPDSAAVNECVKLAKRYGHSASAGYVNGILHSVARGRKTLQYPKDKLDLLSVKYSYPAELVRNWIAAFGAEFAEQFMKASNQEPRMVLRVNTLKTSAQQLIKQLKEKDIKAEQSSMEEDAIFTSGFDVAASELYQQGLFTPQDIAAMTAVKVLQPESGGTVIDMCSAPGGKTTYIAQLMENKGSIYAFDVHPHKVELIDKNAKRLGISIIHAQCADSSVYRNEYSRTADRVLADVPCSGFGIIRRKPDIKYNIGDMQELNDLQYCILKNAAEYVKLNGELVYSTCTIERAENEDMIEKFLKENNEFERVDITSCLPNQLQKETAKNGYVTFYPNTDHIDGFFICKLKRIV